MQALWLAWMVGLLGFLVLWPLSLLRRDASVVDFWWAPGIGAMALVAWFAAEGPRGPHAAVLLVLLVGWALRLGWVLAARRLREGAEDPRYTDLRRAWDPGFWWKSFFVVFLLQGILQGAVAAGALSALLAEARPFGPLGGIGVAVSLAGLVVEGIADRQLDRFRRQVPHGGLLSSGLRAHMRYPSYAGEIAAWGGIALIAVEAGVWWAPASWALLMVLLLKLSGVPILDTRLAATRPGYAAYRDAVPALLPRLGPLLSRRGAKDGTRA